MSRLDKEISRLSVYASMLADQDTRVPGPQGMQQEMQQLAADFKAQVAYVEPELLHVGVDTIERFIDVGAAAEDLLVLSARHRAPRARTRCRTPRKRFSRMPMPLAASGHNIYNILANADFPYPTITLSDGRTAKVDPGRLRGASHAAEPRRPRAAMSTFFTALGSFNRTFGTMMNANVQRVAFYAKSRKYSSHLEAALDGPNIPVSVYTRLIDGMNRWLPTFHRYLKLRKQMMGLTDQLHYHDLYAPLVAEVELTFTPEEAQQHVLDALRPLGTDYCDVVRRVVQRALDRLLSDRRASGRARIRRRRVRRASVHAAELPRAVQRRQHAGARARATRCTATTRTRRSRTRWRTIRRLSRRSHRRSTRRCSSIACCSRHDRRGDAAVAARQLPREHQGHRVPPDAVRRVRAADAPDGGARRADHRRRAQPSSISTSPASTTATPTASASSTTTSRNEWSYIPHFYREFYVFQYATSFTAAEALSEKVLAGRRGGAEALSDVPRVGNVEVPDRAAEGRGRRHDDR